MTLEKAVEILTTQRDRVKDLNSHSYSSWQNQTISFIKDFFGEQSEEYKFLKEFHFVHGWSDLPHNQQIKSESLTAYEFINRCIETLNHKGLPKESGATIFPAPPLPSLEKPNILRRLLKVDIISLVILIAGLIFSAGWYFGERKADMKNIELKNENSVLKEKLQSSSPPKVTNDIPGSDTSGNKKKVNPDTSHTSN